MNAPSDIIRVWERFSTVATETLTKAWWYKQCHNSPRQRPVELIRQHREEHGGSGNCFDVAIWLQEEFTAAGIEAQIIGLRLFTPKAHIAVIAVDERGQKYFCDLGDQWLQPILVSTEAPGFSPEYHSGFAPGTRVRVDTIHDQLFFTFASASGKQSIEQFRLTPVPADVVWRAADHSQALLRRPFVEIRLLHEESQTIQLWEYERNECRWHLDTGIFSEKFDHPVSWIERINNMTGISMHVISTAFDVYAEHGTEM